MITRTYVNGLVSVWVIIDILMLADYFPVQTGGPYKNLTCNLYHDSAKTVIGHDFCSVLFGTALPCKFVFI